MESQNNTPWLQTSATQHAFWQLESSLKTDCVIVWWWIAWCMTAYFLLQETDKKVVLVDANKIAHGASGHNAGQIDVFFEKPVQDLIKEYGEEMTKNAYQAMFDARERLEEVIMKIKRTGQYSKYVWYNVYTTRQQILNVLEELAIFDSLGLEINEFFIREDAKEELAIPHRYAQYCNWISASEWSTYLSSDTLSRLGFEATHYATTNSAHLCYSILEYLLEKYPDRFHVFEHTPIGEVEYKNAVCNLKTHAWYILTAQDVVLATNAYQSYTINGEKDNHHVYQIRGYMAGYYVNNARSPLTICNQPPGESFTEGYYYQSIRKYKNAYDEHILVTVWWPDETTDHRKHHFPDDIKSRLDKHVSGFYNKSIDGNFYWRGDMGYTDTGMRKIWVHPQYPHICYNLGCNGVGILGSIHGGWKIAQHMQGKPQLESVFDVKWSVV